MDYFSYLDAGTGSVIVQAVIGAVAGVGLFGRRAIANIKYKFKSAESNKGK